MKTFRIAVCGCGHTWTTEAKDKNVKCSACAKTRAMVAEPISATTGKQMFKNYDPKPIKVVKYWAVKALW